MIRWLSILLTVLFFALLTACTSPAASPTPQPLFTPSPPLPFTPTPPRSNTSTPAPTLSPTPSPLPTRTPLPTPLPNTTQYTLDATLDYTGKTLTIAETIRYFNDTGQNLNELLLVVEPNWTEGVFQLDELTIEDTPVKNWTLSGNLLRLPLAAFLAANTELTLSLTYRLTLPAQAGMLAYDQRGINLGNWYPFIPPYESGTGWLAYQKSWVGEHFSHPLAAYAITLTVLHAPDNLVIAASAPVEQDANPEPNTTRYHFYLPLARSFALALSPDFTVFQTTVGNVQILSYAYPETLAAGERAMQVTADALALYNDLFGPYPHKTMAVVQVSFPDGMEFDGLYFLSEQYYWGYPPNPDRLTAAQNYLTIIAAHETSHQWWYALTGNDQAIEPWLDETFATYTERLFYEHYYPELVDWWWAFRVDYYSPRDCCVNDTVYQYGDSRAYINAVYLRGAYFMQELRDTMGDEAFLAALKTYAQRYRYGFVTAKDFWDVIGEYTNEDLTILRQRYFGGG
ncbi:MAG: M1 family metallopeptidase [Anaerolineales bacterium]|nr:M1 family metallopeptidase [Anaerolineales bacterium]